MTDLKAVWKIELEILSEIDKICKKYNLTYFVSSGTLLGSIRHKGFIPWDDDIDLVMFRNDYNKFLKVVFKELDENFFCQSGYNDKGFYGGLLHIRKNNTTAIQMKHFPNLKYHQGIFVDIFPLDGVFENPFLNKLQYFSKKFLNAIMHEKNTLVKEPITLKRVIFKPFSLLPQKLLFRTFEKICSIKKAEKARFVDTVSYFGSTVKRESNIYREKIYLPFENITVPVPIDYDKLLKIEYGIDYMIPKHVATDHGNMFFDTENDYNDYLNGKIKICQNQ